MPGLERCEGYVSWDLTTYIILISFFYPHNNTPPVWGFLFKIFIMGQS